MVEASAATRAATGGTCLCCLGAILPLKFTMPSSRRSTREACVMWGLKFFGVAMPACAAYDFQGNNNTLKIKLQDQLKSCIDLFSLWHAGLFLAFRNVRFQNMTAA